MIKWRQFKLIGAVMFFSPPQALRYKVHLLAALTIVITPWEIELQLFPFELQLSEVELQLLEVEISFAEVEFTF